MTSPTDGGLPDFPQDFRRRLRVAMSQPKQGVRNPAPWYRINNQADGGAAAAETDVYLYDVIGGWCGITADQFVADLNTIESPVINLHIASPGGDVFDAIAIFQALRNHKARIVTYVDSLAASAASFIAMAGDKRIIAPYGSVMIHDAWGLCVGNAAEMSKMLSELDRLSDIIASIYANRGTGGDKADWREAMLQESWYSAQEAVEAGLMHEVQEDAEKGADDKPAASNRFDLSVFNYAGRDNAPAPHLPGRPSPKVAGTAIHVPPAAEPDSTETKEGGVSTLSTDVLARLGLTEGADDTAVLAAIDALKVQASAPVEPDTEDEDEGEDLVTVPDPEPVTVEDPAAKVNTDLAEKVAMLTDQVQAMGAQLAASNAEKAAATKASVLDSAAKAGKFAPADRQAWAARYDKSPDVTTEVLAAIPAGSAVPVAAVGEIGDPEPHATAWNDAEYDRLFGEKASN